MSVTECPYISVIIPTCGRPELLLECVTSLMKNDYTNFEIIIVDQDPAQILKTRLIECFANDPRLIYLFVAQRGASIARNRGIQHAKGEIMVFVDDDLEVVPGCLKAYITSFTMIEPPPGMVGGQVKPCWLSEKPVWFPAEREYLLGLYYDQGNELKPMREGDLPITANCAVHRKVIDQVGLLDERIGFSYARKNSMVGGEDSLWAIKIKQANYAVYYQPLAIAWHKIPRSKLTKKYFFKRNFWEGVTTVSVLHLSGSEMVANLPGVIRWHFREIGRQMWRALSPKNTSWKSLLQAKTQMHLAAAWAYSLGVIYASAKMLLTKQLP